MELTADDERLKGNAAFGLGDHTLALSHYTKAIELESTNHIHYSNRSAANIKLNQYLAALEDAQAAITLSEGHFIKAFLRRADANFALGNLHIAFDDYKYVYERDRSYSIAQESLDKILSMWFEDRLRLTHASKVAVKFIDSNVGKGLFATNSIETGEIILRERPLNCVQWTRSKSSTICCARCLKFVGSLSYQATFLAHTDSIVELPMASAFDAAPPEFCPHCETFPYCSTTCRQLAWEENHRILCPKTGSRALSFYQHAQTEGVDRFLLAAQIVVSILIKIERGITFDKAWGPYSHLVSCTWTDILAQRAESTPNSVHQIRTAMSVSLNLLIRTIQEMMPKLNLRDLNVSRVLKIDFYASLLGSFELNNPKIEILSPLYKYFLFLGQQCPQVIHEHPYLASLLQFINAQHDGVPPSCEGEGVFPLHSTMNHSCQPTAKQVLSPDGVLNAEVVIVATRRIEKGEEITISYVDLNDPALQSTENRRQRLQTEYLFTCNCVRCRRTSGEVAQALDPQIP